MSDVSSLVQNNGRSHNAPLLHLASRDVDGVGLTATAHGEVGVEGRKALALVALGDDVERRRVVEDVVVKSEVTTT